MNIDPTRNPISDMVEVTMEMNRVSIGGSFEATIAPAASKTKQGGQVDTGGNWQPYGRVGITPVSDFRVAP